LTCALCAQLTQDDHVRYLVTLDPLLPGTMDCLTRAGVSIVNDASALTAPQWQPFLDIGAGTHPGPVSARETLCFQLMRAAGQASTSATVKGFQVQICNAIFSLKVAADAMPSLPADLLAAVRPVIGTSYAPADTFRSDVTRRPDGAAGYRQLAYESGCSCFQYVSAIRTAS
jgi:hypothetical protein